MDQKYYVPTGGGGLIGPFTVEELNEEIRRERLVVPASGSLHVAGSSMRLVARQIEGLRWQDGSSLCVDDELQKTDRAASWLMGGLTLFLLVKSLTNGTFEDYATPATKGALLVVVLGFYIATQIHAGERKGFVGGLLYTGFSIGMAIYGLSGSHQPSFARDMVVCVPFIGVFLYCGYRLLPLGKKAGPTLFIHPSLINESDDQSRTEQEILNGFAVKEGTLEASSNFDSKTQEKASDGPVQKMFDLTTELERLAELRKQGLLTEEEFSHAKGEVLIRGRHA